MASYEGTANNDLIAAGPTAFGRTTPRGPGALGDALVNQGNAFFEDALLFGGNDIAQAGDGEDKIDGGLGDDYIAGGGGNDIALLGNEGDDRIYGQAGNDQISGEDGSDCCYGGSGNDTMEDQEGDDPDFYYGGTGNDFLDGNNGDDCLQGQEGNDFLDGEGGRDRLFGGTGDDILDGGGEDDLFIFQGANSGGVNLLQDFDQDGNDVIRLRAMKNSQGTLIDSFSDIDTNNDGFITTLDTGVTAGNVNITVAPGNISSTDFALQISLQNSAGQTVILALVDGNSTTASDFQIFAS